MEDPRADTDGRNVAVIFRDYKVTRLMDGEADEATRCKCNSPTRQMNPNQKARNPKSKIPVERYKNTLRKKH